VCAEGRGGGGFTLKKNPFSAKFPLIVSAKIVKICNQENHSIELWVTSSIGCEQDVEP
jgi:hypothetical protein